MAISPGTYNISLQRRADYSITPQFKDSNDTAINLTGWTVAAQACPTIPEGKTSQKNSYHERVTHEQL